MKLSYEEVLHIARLSRLGLDDKEVERLSKQLSNILGQFEVLQNVDTEGVPATAQSVDLKTVLHPDKIEPSLIMEQVLQNAPKSDDGFIRVRPVLE
jgi:aspartyl-tRNA(Asn)/glutamyl-tRNA(Gln) amidotransferase subunit C